MGESTTCPPRCLCRDNVVLYCEDSTSLEFEAMTTTNGEVMSSTTDFANEPHVWWYILPLTVLFCIVLLGVLIFCCVRRRWGTRIVVALGLGGERVRGVENPNYEQFAMEGSSSHSSVGEQIVDLQAVQE